MLSIFDYNDEFINDFDIDYFIRTYVDKKGLMQTTCKSCKNVFKVPAIINAVSARFCGGCAEEMQDA